MINRTLFKLSRFILIISFFVFITMHNDPDLCVARGESHPVIEETPVEIDSRTNDFWFISKYYKKR